jgi:hypothetical protein
MVAKARIVDKEGDALAGRSDPYKELTNFVVIGQIGGETMNYQTWTLDRHSKLLQSIGSARDQKQASGLGRELPGKFGADA